MTFNMPNTIWTLILMVASTTAIFRMTNDLMKCSYGERGSLTATCVNANASFFRTTPYRFDQLDETLRCVNCSLKAIDSGTFDISGNQIKFLELRNCQAEMLKQRAFVGLIFLENLDLSYNSIRSIYPGTFMGIQKIKRIDLSHNQINILSDDGFLELVNLVELNLEFNYIQTISSKAFNGLATVSVLNLRHNQVTDLKDIFANTSSLQILNLEDNHITSLTGAEFINLTSLLSLNLAKNKLKNPIIELIPQNQLINLYLQENSIDILSPKFLKGLHKLENLDLSHNHIGEVNQKTLQSLYQLKNLNLSYNLIETLQTGTFSGLPQLDMLNVSYNSIKNIQITGVFSLHSLHALDLSHNSLEDLDYVGLISRLPRLSYLKLEDNRLPCDLEDEMNTYFLEDNFKVVLFESTSALCVQKPTKKSQESVDTLAAIATPVKVKDSSLSGGEVTIVVFLSILFVSIGVLFYLQFRTYQQLNVWAPKRATSSVNLVSAEENNDDYLRE